VHVHVPQPGDEKLPASIDDARVRRRLRDSGRSDGDDASAAYDHRLIGTRHGVGSIDHRDVREGDGALRENRVMARR
jgi:hypothetical protein